MENQLMLPEPSIEALAEEMERKQLKDYKISLLVDLIREEKSAKKDYEDRLSYISEKRKMVNNLTVIPNYNRCEWACSTTPCRY